MEFNYLQYIVSIVLLIGLLVLVQYGAKHLKARRFSGDIQIKDRAVIDNGVSLVIVSVRDKELLLGVSNKDIQIVKELS